ncbi:MAG: type II secretion system protein GspL [Gammaproteobacteria bacterium]|nr:type II secretion system protein GspL [Gammaproteobacteria bacterium]
METLFLRFLANSDNRVIDEDTSVRWVLVTDESEANDCGMVKLTNASTLIQDRKVVILLPIEHLYITSVAVQTKNKKQLEKAIPYALEDDLTEDIEDLHFSLGKRNDDGEIPVIVISKIHLDHLIKILGSVNVLPDVITSDIFGLDWSKDQWTLCIDDGHLLARTQQCNGFGCETNDFTDFMNVTLSEQSENPSKIVVYSHPDENLEDIVKLPNIQLDDFWSPSAFIKGFSNEECINLLQGSYVKADKQHKTIRPWKIAAALTAIWITISMANMGLEYSRLNKLDKNLSAEIDQIFKRTFPEVKNVVNARVQMQQRIKALSASDSNVSEADFLKFLHQSGYELYKDSNISITELQYKNNKLSLDIKTKNIQVLEAVKSKLQSKNINAELQTAKTVDDFVMARMQVSE